VFGRDGEANESKRVRRKITGKKSKIEEREMCVSSGEKVRKRERKKSEREREKSLREIRTVSEEVWPSVRVSLPTPVGQVEWGRNHKAKYNTT
jgi:hypothetical protein